MGVSRGLFPRTLARKARWLQGRPERPVEITGRRIDRRRNPQDSDLWTEVATGFAILLSTDIEADFSVCPREFPWWDAVGPTEAIERGGPDRQQSEVGVTESQRGIVCAIDVTLRCRHFGAAESFDCS
jgi:hypothetical protein